MTTSRAHTIARAAKLHGWNSPRTLGVISRVLGVTEAEAAKYARTLTEGAPTPRRSSATAAEIVEAEVRAATGGRGIAQLDTFELQRLADALIPR